jgi:hypothetical protein
MKKSEKDKISLLRGPFPFTRIIVCAPKTPTPVLVVINIKSSKRGGCLVV